MNNSLNEELTVLIIKSAILVSPRSYPIFEIIFERAARDRFIVSSPVPTISQIYGHY